MGNDPINLLDSAGFDAKFAGDCAKRVAKKVVDKALNAWKNPAANKEYQQLTDAAQDRAKDSAETYKNKLEQTAQRGDHIAALRSSVHDRPKVVLEGAGMDLENGSLGDSALSWVSSIDGALGAGQLLEVSLSLGVHTITLTATDSGGLTSTASIQITVVQPTPIKHVFLPLVIK